MRSTNSQARNPGTSPSRSGARFRTRRSAPGEGGRNTSPPGSAPFCTAPGVSPPRPLACIPPRWRNNRRSPDRRRETPQEKTVKNVHSNLEVDPESVAAGLPGRELELIDAYWRACNYLAVGMIYLQDNPLLREPLRTDHVKQRLLGHWGASPALSFVWVHLNRLIRKHELAVMFVAGPGH